MKKAIALGAFIVAANCAAIPYGGEVDFSNSGSASCAAADGRVLTGTESENVRCTPQSQSVSP